MKNLIAKMIAAGCLYIAMVAQADTWTDPDTGYTWTYRIVNGEAEICATYDWLYELADGSKSPSSCTPAVSPWPDGHVDIPSMLGGKPVTSIGDFAFYTLGSSHYDYASGYKRKFTSVAIPNGVKSIGYGAFMGCSELLTVSIPDSVTSIGDLAFEVCSGLMEISVSNGNSKYKSIDGMLLTKDGKRLVQGVNSATAIPDGVTTVDSGAFNSLYYIERIFIPASVTSIGDGPFRYCSSLAEISVAPGNTKYKSANGMLLSKDGKKLIQGVNGDVIIPNGVVSIEDYAFGGMSVMSVSMPSSVTSIGHRAFSTCFELTSVTMSDSVTSIGDWAFANCLNLMQVRIPDSVTSIGAYAFAGCGLTSVTIPNSVTSIGNYAFSYCSGLADENGFVIVRNVIYSYHGVGGALTIPSDVTRIEAQAFGFCDSLTSVSIPASVTSIMDGAFSPCANLKEISVASDNTKYTV